MGFSQAVYAQRGPKHLRYAPVTNSEPRYQWCSEHFLRKAEQRAAILLVRFFIS